MKNINKNIFIPFLFFIFAATIPLKAEAGVNSLEDVIQLFVDFNVDLLIPIAFSLGVLYFMWRGVAYIYHSDSEEGKTEGKRVLMWGVIALFFMVSIFGIIRFLQLDILGITPPTDLPVLERQSK